MKYVTINNNTANIKMKGKPLSPDEYLVIMDEYRDALANGITEINLDFSETEDINSMGIGFVADIMKDAKIRKMKAFGANKMVYAQFRHIKQFKNIFDEE